MSRSNSGSGTMQATKAASRQGLDFESTTAARHRAEPTTSQLVLAGTYGSSGQNALVRREEFKRLMMAIGARLRPYAKTRADQKALDNIKTGDYGFVALHRILDVAVQSNDPFFVADTLRAETLVRMPKPKAIGAHDAVIASIGAQNEAMVAVATWQRDRCRASAGRAAEKSRAASRAALALADTLAVAAGGQ